MGSSGIAQSESVNQRCLLYRTPRNFVIKLFCNHPLIRVGLFFTVKICCGGCWLFDRLQKQSPHPSGASWQISSVSLLWFIVYIYTYFLKKNPIKRDLWSVNKYGSLVEVWAGLMDVSCAYFWETQTNTENIHPQTPQAAKWTFSFSSSTLLFQLPPYFNFFFGFCFQIFSVLSLYCD